MINIRSLTKQYKMGDSIVNALDNVSLDVKQGEFVAIVGASGSGKTTLMNILGCLDRPTDGEYHLDGDKVFSMSGRALSGIRNRKIGFIFQSFNLIPSLTAWENIELPLIYRKTPRSAREKLVEEAIKMVGLYDRRAHRPFELSGGQQQRVAIARAIAAKPPLILADEPCGNLDSKSGKDIMNILHDLHQSGRTIVLITHDDRAAESAEAIIRIRDGRIAI